MVKFGYSRSFHNVKNCLDFSDFSFRNYVDNILAFLTVYPPDIFYAMNVDKNGPTSSLWTTPNVGVGEQFLLSSFIDVPCNFNFLNLRFLLIDTKTHTFGKLLLMVFRQKSM